MTDKELLENAAKAVGQEYDHLTECITTNGIQYAQWNPLTDDGDALRLAVKLDIELYQGDDDGPAVFAGYWGKPERRDVTRLFCSQAIDGDPYAATRRAIVRAAAEIGKGME